MGIVPQSMSSLWVSRSAALITKLPVSDVLTQFVGVKPLSTGVGSMRSSAMARRRSIITALAGSDPNRRTCRSTTSIPREVICTLSGQSCRMRPPALCGSNWRPLTRPRTLRGAVIPLSSRTPLPASAALAAHTTADAVFHTVMPFIILQFPYVSPGHQAVH